MLSSIAMVLESSTSSQFMTHHLSYHDCPRQNRTRLILATWYGSKLQLKSSQFRFCIAMLTRLFSGEFLEVQIKVPENNDFFLSGSRKQSFRSVSSLSSEKPEWKMKLSFSFQLSFSFFRISSIWFDNPNRCWPCLRSNFISWCFSGTPQNGFNAIKLRQCWLSFLSTTVTSWMHLCQ